MRLARLALLQVEDHVINLKTLQNAFLEQWDSYPAKYGVRYFTQGPPVEDPNGALGFLIPCSSKKAALAALTKIAEATDTLLIEEDA